MKPETRQRNILIELWWTAFEDGRLAEFSGKKMPDILVDAVLTRQRTDAITSAIEKLNRKLGKGA